MLYCIVLEWAADFTKNQVKIEDAKTGEVLKDEPMPTTPVYFCMCARAVGTKVSVQLPPDAKELLQRELGLSVCFCLSPFFCCCQWSGLIWAVSVLCDAGCSDEKTWVPLHSMTNDGTLDTPGEVHSWEIKQAHSPCVELRLRLTGPNSDEQFSIALSALEFFGKLRSISDLSLGSSTGDSSSSALTVTDPLDKLPINMCVFSQDPVLSCPVLCPDVLQ